MRHGTAYHDITDSLRAHRTLVTHEYDPRINNLEEVFNSFPLSFVKTEINVSGSSANAGGRSGNINFDGSIELNIGANSSDKQSLWLDTQGGMLGSIGRDFNGVSMGLSLTGDLLVQVGGADVGFNAGPMIGSDPRFSSKIDPVWRSGAVDIRVYGPKNESDPTIVRIDKDGVTISSPGHINIESNKSLTLKALHSINLEAEAVLFWNSDPSSTREIIRNNKSLS